MEYVVRSQMLGSIDNTDKFASVVRQADAESRQHSIAELAPAHIQVSSELGVLAYMLHVSYRVRPIQPRHFCHFAAVAMRCLNPGLIRPTRLISLTTEC